jgi:hypothetical protein
MVATDLPQKQGFIAGLLDLSEEDAKRLAGFGRAAMDYAQQPMDSQVMPIQRGGGLLQMMPVPAMQPGQGLGAINYTPDPSNEMNIEKVLGLLAKMTGAGV